MEGSYWARSSYLKTLAKFGQLLVYYAESEVNLIGFLEIRLHLHHLGESFLGMLEGAVSVVKDADAIPEFRFLFSIRTARAGLRRSFTFGFDRLYRAD